jgi:DNA repair exonuclease SbcCD nuclease subunit
MIRSATRDAFENLVDLAIDEGVEFVILSGDLADGDWKNTQTMLWLNGQFRRLEEDGIQVYTIRGNHDAQNNLSKSITLAGNVHEFPKKPYTFKDPNGRYAIHGQSYPSREVKDNLVKDYPEAIDGMFNIGMLHTNLIGSSEHANYAPTTMDELKAKGYNYWALGHVHNKAIVHECPHIIYPGNTQGRNIRETGERGCYQVTVDEDYKSNIEFVPLQVVRWEKVRVESNPDDGVVELLNKVRSVLEKIVSSMDDNLTVVRVIIHGPNREYGRLESPNGLEEFKNSIRDIANSSSSPIWIEKIKVELQAPIDIETLKKSDTLLGDLLRLTEEIGNNPESLNDLISKDIASFREKAALEIEKTEKNLDNIDLLTYYLERAESILISHISEVGQ